MSRSRCIALFVFSCVAAVVYWLSSNSSAQNRIIVNGGVIIQNGQGKKTDPEPNLAGSRTFVTDREVTGAFRDAQSLLKEGQYEDGLGILQQILDSPEDLFFNPQVEDKSHYRSIKTEAHRLIAQLPQEGRELYELQVGSAAAQMLKTALNDGDMQRLAEVARRYFHTKAGYAAMYRIGAQHLDRSEPLAAALFFDRLRKIPQAKRGREPMLSLKAAVSWGRAGMPEQAVRTLVDLKTSLDGKRISMGGKQYGLFARNEDALGWLVSVLGQQQQFAAIGEEQWTMFRGNASRTASSAPANPLWEPQWSFESFSAPLSAIESSKKFPEAITTLAALVEEKQKANRPSLPATYPLVVGNIVVFRTLSNLRAVDLKTGELLWESSVIDPAYKHLVQDGTNAQAGRKVNGRTIINGRVVNQTQTPLKQFISQRAHSDLASGTLSSDGKYVYSLEDLGSGGAYYNPRGGSRPVWAANTFNKLMSFEVATGKLKWEIGGPAGQSALDHAGLFFLGPPLPLAGRLYCLAEVAGAGEIRLLVFELDTQVVEPATQGSAPRELVQPKLVWSQPLLLPETQLLSHPIRRLAGISPSYSDGVMICPTTAGAVVAVDLARRTLMWGYRYVSKVPAAPGGRRRVIFGMNGVQNTANDAEGHWQDAAPTIAEGRVLLTPRDSDQLHCLDLVDGRVLWRKARGQSYYVAAVQNGNAIVVGRNDVQAWKLTDGTPAWREPVPIPEPSGRGFRTDRFYHLPLSTSELATLDLQDGRLLVRSKAAEGQTVGNLVSAGGVVISQSVDKLTALKSLAQIDKEIAAGLKKNSGDALALAKRGELHLHRGREEKGLIDIRRSVEIQPTPRTKSLLAETLLDGLRHDFATYRKHAEEMRSLIDDPTAKSRFLRLHAAGLQQVGELEAAFAEYLRLAGPEIGKPRLEKTNALLASRSDRWVRPRIQGLYAAATGNRRAGMLKAFQGELKAAIKSEGPDRLRRFIAGFDGLPVADEARRELVARLDEKQQGLEIENLLARLRDSKDPALEAFATAKWASLMISHGRPQDAKQLVGELGSKYADVACLDRRTGRQLVDQWLADKKVFAALAAPKPWPAKDLAATSSPRSTGIPVSYPLELLSADLDEFRSWSFAMDQTRQKVIAYDSKGQQQWTVSILANGRTVRNIYGNTIQLRGHLAVVGLGTHFVVIDTLHSSGSPRILWSRDLTDGNPNNVQMRQIAVGGVVRMIVQDRYGRRMGGLGTVTDDHITYQVGSRVYAADPRTGDVLWDRGGITRGSSVFGDQQFTFVAASGSTQATVLRASDGEYVTARTLPTGRERIAIVGRRVLASSRDDGKGQLVYTDLGTGKIIWKRDHHERAIVRVVRSENIALYDPTGRFLLLDLETGKPRVDSPIEIDAAVSQIYVLGSRDRFTLLTYNPAVGPKGVRANAIGYNNPIVSGFAYGFDRASGKKIWTTKIEQQSLVRGQPQNVPFLVFTVRRNQFNRGLGGVRRNVNQNVVQILDKRNGKIVFEQSGTQTMFPYHLRVDNSKQTFNLDFSRLGVALRFDDKPLSKASTAPKSEPAKKDVPAKPEPQANKKPKAPADPK
jgi:outer membrane protein assembly factor BamB